MKVCVEPGEPQTFGGASVCCHLANTTCATKNLETVQKVVIGLVLKLISMLGYWLVSKAPRFGEYCTKTVPVHMLFPSCCLEKCCFWKFMLVFCFCLFFPQLANTFASLEHFLKHEFQKVKLYKEEKNSLKSCAYGKKSVAVLLIRHNVENRAQIFKTPHNTHNMQNISDPVQN